MREIEELQNRNNLRIFVGLGVACAIALVLGLVLAPKGVGVAEEDHRVLIVEDGAGDLIYYLGDLGFEGLAAPYEVWQDKVAEDDEDLEPGEVGLVELLAFADRYGYGYLVIEHPQRLSSSIAALELDGEPEVEGTLAGVGFAVLSVGDFASPHALSVDPPAEGVELYAGPRLLRALFAQPRLAESLDENSASSDAQARRLKLDHAIEAHERIAMAEGKAARVVEGLQAELDGLTLVGSETRAKPLRGPLEGASAYPLADGRVVLRTSALDFVVGVDGLDLRGAPGFAMQVIPADLGATAAAVQPCPELLGGGGPRGALDQVRLSAERDALFVLDREGHGTLFVLDPEAGACGLREAGSLELPGFIDEYVSVHRTAVATRDVVDGRLTLEVHEIPAGDEGTDVIIGPELERGSSLVWLDDERLAALVEVEERAAVVFADLDREGETLLLPLDNPNLAEVDGWWRARELQRIPGDEPALLLRWQDDRGFHLTRLDFDRPWAALLGTNPEGEEPAPLGPESLAWTPVLTIEGHIRGFDIDPQGQAVALSVEGDLGVDVGVVALPARGDEPETLRLLIDDAYEHREVAFRPGRSELLFRTRVRVDEMPGASLLAVHALPLD